MDAKQPQPRPRQAVAKGIGVRLAIVPCLLVCLCAAGPAEAAKAYPEAHAAFARANLLLRRGLYAQAAKMYRRALHIEPGFAAAHNNLGVALYKQGRFDEALTHFERVVASGDTHKAGGLLNAGASLSAKGDADAGLKRAKESVTEKDTYAEAHFNIGWIQDARGQWPLAEKAYREAIRHRPNYMKATLGLAIVLGKQEKFEKGLALLRAMLRRRVLRGKDRKLAKANLEAVHAFAAVANPTPKEGTRVRDLDRLVLKWGAEVGDSSDAPELTFSVRLGEDPESLPKQREHRVRGHTCSLKGRVRRGKTYYWQAIACTPDGRRAVSRVYSFKTPRNSPPTTHAPERVTTNEQTPVDIELTGRDPDGDALTFRVSQAPTHGTLSGKPPRVTYTAGAGFHGEDAFEFVANDGAVDGAPATVRIRVLPKSPTAPSPSSDHAHEEDADVEVAPSAPGKEAAADTAAPAPEKDTDVEVAPPAPEEDTAVEVARIDPGPKGDTAPVAATPGPSHATLSVSPLRTPRTPPEPFFVRQTALWAVAVLASLVPYLCLMGFFAAKRNSAAFLLALGLASACLVGEYLLRGHTAGMLAVYGVQQLLAIALIVHAMRVTPG